MADEPSNQDTKTHSNSETEVVPNTEQEESHSETEVVLDAGQEESQPSGSNAFLLMAAVAAVVLGAGVIGITIYAVRRLIDGANLTYEPPSWVSITVVSIMAIAAIAAVFLRERGKSAARKEDQERIENAAEYLKERMELASLVNFNRVLLERYHGVATKQANKSFVSSLIAMSVGLAVLVGAFIASMQFNAMGERIFIGSLAALSVAFVGYLSKTFLAVYDRSLQQLNQYFNQPVLNQYFLSAERVAERIEGDKKEELLSQIVLEVLDTGKQMHEIATATPARRARTPRQRKAANHTQTPTP